MNARVNKPERKYEFSRMRPPPPRQVDGSFVPYPVEDLNRARGMLIDELYFAPGGGRLLYRIRELTGILPNRQGIFIDAANYCEQSTSLLSKSIPETTSSKECKEKRTESKVVNFDKGLGNALALQTNESDNGLFRFCRQKSQMKVQVTTTETAGTKRHIYVDKTNSEKLTVKKRKEGEHSNRVIQNDDDLSYDGFSDSQTNPANSFTVCGFKCDFCDYISENRTVVQKHLVTKLHYSASTVECVSSSGWLTAKYLLKEKSLINQAALFCTVISICSFCHCIFKDIYSCAKHVKKTHRKVRMYYLGVVRKQQTVIVHKAGKCNECDQCLTSKQLTKHLKTHSAKDMLYECPQPQDIVWCICSVCNSYFNNIISCKSHVFSHFNKIKENMATFELLFITKPTTEYQILPQKDPAKKTHFQKRKRKRP